MSKKKTVKKVSRKPVTTKKKESKKIQYIDHNKLVDFWKINPLKIQCINPESDNIHEVLGITQERSNELAKSAHMALLTTKKFTEAIDFMINSCTHINEIVYSLIIMSDIKCSMNNPLMKLLGGIK
jgi:CRISPR/Cas system CSM-associated protein Csm4 (group 5 of RAMP superfamily)